MTRQAIRSILAAALAAIALVAVGACSNDLSGDETERSEEGEVVEGGDVGALSLQVGDCVADSTIGLVDDVPVVPCDEPHQSEVFHAFDLPDGDFPGDASIDADVEAGCTGKEFGAYVGKSYADSILAVSFLKPSQETWEQIDDREVICLAQNPDSTDLEASVKGSGI